MVIDLTTPMSSQNTMPNHKNPTLNSFGDDVLRGLIVALLDQRLEQLGQHGILELDLRFLLQKFKGFSEVMLSEVLEAQPDCLPLSNLILLGHGVLNDVWIVVSLEGHKPNGKVEARLPAFERSDFDVLAGQIVLVDDMLEAECLGNRVIFEAAVNEQKSVGVIGKVAGLLFFLFLPIRDGHAEHLEVLEIAAVSLFVFAESDPSHDGRLVQL